MDLSGNVVRAALVAAVLLGGCSRGEDEASVPEACRDPGVGLRSALERAPGPVKLGGRPISACLTKAGDAADLQRAGTGYVDVAAELSATATARPEGAEALRLGYLVGAVRRGAQTTQGLHSELLRRLEQEAAPLERGSAAYRRGERAGERGG